MRMKKIAFVIEMGRHIRKASCTEPWRKVGVGTVYCVNLKRMSRSGTDMPQPCSNRIAQYLYGPLKAVRNTDKK